MSRLTLRLPETLHRQLETKAKHEGVSLNHYIVYALTQQTAWGYQVTALSEEAVKEQRAQFDALLARLGSASEAQVHDVLAERDEVAAEPELDEDVVARLQKRMG